MSAKTRRNDLRIITRVVLIAGLLAALYLTAPPASAQAPSSPLFKDVEQYYLTEAEAGLKICREEGMQRFFGSACAPRGLTPPDPYITAWQRADRGMTTEKQFREGHANLARGSLAQSTPSFQVRVSEIRSQGAALYYTRTEPHSFKHWVFAQVQIPGRGPAAISNYFEIIAMRGIDQRTRRDLPAPDASSVSARILSAILARMEGTLPEPPTAGAGRLVVRGVGADFKQGVWLDGQSPVEFEAVLTDTQGKPMTGIPVELAVVDRDLPRRGQLSYLGSRTTDAQGRVRGRYLPPRVEERELQRQGPILGFQARAMPKGGQPVDANENVLAHALVPAFLSVSRAGYLPVERVPVQLPSLRAGSIRGSVIYRFNRTAFDSSAGPAVRTVNEYSVAGAKVELSVGQKRLGEALTDARGSFQLDFTVQQSSAPLPSFTLPDPIAFLGYEPTTKGRLALTREALMLLGTAKTYGYQVEPLLNQIDERFPARFAAAATASAIETEQERLHRVGLLVTALWKTHDLVEHSAGQWADSLGALVESLLDVFDPLDKLKSEGLAPEVVKWARFTREQTALKRNIVERALATLSGKIYKVASSANLSAASGTLYEATAWSYTKEKITKYLLRTDDDTKDPDWRPLIVDGLMSPYRDLAQKELQRAAQLWEAGKIPVGGRQGPLFAARYQEIADHKDQVTAQQLNLDLYKADVKLGTDLVGNGIKIIATGYGAVAVAEGVEMVEKGLKTVNVGLDAFQGYLWLQDYGVGMRAISQFARAALELRSYCVGAAC